MDNWHNKKLEQIGKIFSGSTPSTNKQQYWGGDIVWITPDDLSKLRTPYLFTSERKITEAGLNASSLTLLSPGSIVISSRAPIGYLAIPQVEFCTNQGCKSIDLKAQTDSEFTYYNILFNLAKLKNMGEGTTFAEISKTALSNVELPFPDDKDEQSYIAAVLSAIDKTIEQTETIINKQTRIKTGLMQDLLTKGIDEYGNVRSEKTHKFEDSPLGRISIEWEVKPLRDYLSYISYGFTNPMPEAIDGPYMITAADIIDGQIQYETCRRTTGDAYEELLTNKSRPNMGSLLITKDGTLGRLAIVDRTPLCINQSVAVMRLKDTVDTQFIQLLLESLPFQNSIMADSGGSTIRHIYITRIDKMLLNVPKNINEQIRIRQISNLVNSRISNSKERLKKLTRMKMGLMHDLLTGKVSVTRLLKGKDSV